MLRLQWRRWPEFGTVRVDVPDIARRSIGIGECLAHRGGCAFSVWLGDVVCVGGHAEADDLAENRGVRACALSSVSSTSIAAPSPSVMPSRSAA